MAAFLPDQAGWRRIPVTRAAALQTATPIDFDAVARVLDERRTWIHVNPAARTITADARNPQPDIAVLDITPRGFRMATIDPVPAKAVFTADLTLNDGRRVQALATVTRCVAHATIPGHVVTLEF
jgi:hypothetical protein